MLDSVTGAPAVARDDIVRGMPNDWLVIGWFTPDYKALANDFAGNLSEYGAPLHLWLRPKLVDGWNTSQKPDVVLTAMDAYPGKTLVLMDVDCIVQGDIAPVTNGISGDVGITVFARNVPGRMDRRLRVGADRCWRHHIAVECSSRVVVFKPTAGARAFALAWRHVIATSHVNHDEHSMVWAYLLRPDVSFTFIDIRYSGRDVGQVPDAVICHDSEHNKINAARCSGLQEMLKGLERRYLRTGRTKALNRQLQQDAPVAFQEPGDA